MFDFLIDSHCHFKLMEEEGLAIEDVVNLAKKNGIKVLNNICTKIDEVEEVIQMSSLYDNVFCSVGHHPEEVNNKVATSDELLVYTNNPKVVAIGESGLDYHYDGYDKSKQKQNFEAHIETSRKSHLPLVIHSRDADSDMIDILKSEMKNGAFEFVLHCFSSGKELAYTGLDLGGYISFSGIVTFGKATDLQNIARTVPINRIIVETDSPFLVPTPFRGKVKVNQPMYVKNTAEFLASLFGIDFLDVCDITTNNCLRLFSKMKISQ